MPSLAQLIVKITAQSTDFQRGIAEAQKSAKTMAEKFEVAGSILTRSLSLPLGAFAAVALKSAADFESLNKGLVAVSGGAEKAAAQMERLKKVAELPGLGLREAVQGSINLQAAGISAELAERALKGFGNALATVGKGRAELDGVITALSQIQSKGKVSAEEINQLAERLPQIRVAMQAAFGTASTEAIQKLGLSSSEFISRVVAEFEKLPQVSGGLANSFENLKDRVEQSLAKAGGAIKPFAEQLLNVLDPMIAKIGALAEAFGALPEPIKAATVTLAALAISVGPISLLASKLQQIKVAVLAAAGTGGSLTAAFTTSTLAGVGLAAAITAIAVAIAKLGEADITERLQGLVRASENVKEKLKIKPEFEDVTKDLPKVEKAFSDVANGFSVTARASTKQINDAFDTLKIKPVSVLRDELSKAQQALDVMRNAASFGAISNADYKASVDAVKKAHDALNDALGVTARQVKEFKFPDFTGAVLAEEIGRAEAKAREAVRTFVDLKKSTGDLLAIPPGIQTSTLFEDLEKNAEKARLKLEQVAEHMATLALVIINAAAAQEDFNDAVERIRGERAFKFTKENLPDLKGQLTQVQKLSREISTVVNDLDRGIAGAIVHAKSLGEVFKKVSQDIAEAILRFAINAGIKKLGEELAGLQGILGSIGRKIAEVFGSTKVGVPGVPTGGGGGGIGGGAPAAAAGIVSGGLAGTVTAFASVVSTIFEGLQFFQLRRIEQDIGRIEVTSRSILNETTNRRNDAWEQFGQTFTRLGEISNAATKIYEGLSAIDFSNLLKGGASALGRTVTNNITVQAQTTANPEQIAQAIARKLRLQNAAFA